MAVLVRRRKHGLVALAAGAALVPVVGISDVAEAQQRQVERGYAFAQANCSRCHAIGRAGQSPLPQAPLFRTLHLRYSVDDLVEAFAEGIRATHPMPQFQLNPAQIDDLIAYLKFLAQREPAKIQH